MVISHGGALYATASAMGWHWQELLDFSASINPLGPAPGVLPAIRESLERIVHYPDAWSARLVQTLASEWNIEPDCILAGNGATELIHFFARTWRETKVTLVVPTFSEFHRAWPHAAQVSVTEPWPTNGLLVLTNPNNPTGQWIDPPERTGLTLVDESFLEFTTLPACIGRGMLVLRSLTKFHALPGLRVGALAGPPDVMRWLRARREPWQVNVLAEAAALAGLADREHALRTRGFVSAEREWLMSAVAKLPGVRPMPSVANYVFAELDRPADELTSSLLRRRILIRNCSGMPGVRGEAVRFAVRTRRENQRLIDAWRESVCD